MSSPVGLIADIEKLHRVIVFVFGLQAFKLALVVFFTIRARGKTKTVGRPEDVDKVGEKGSAVADPPEVLLMHAIHKNETENGPLIICALLAFYFGCSFSRQGMRTVDTQVGMALLIIWTVTRWIHTFCFFHAKQPWRTLSFATGLLTTGILAVYGMVKVLLNP